MVNKMQAEMPAFYSLLPTGISLPIFFYRHYIVEKIKLTQIRLHL